MTLLRLPKTRCFVLKRPFPSELVATCDSRLKLYLAPDGIFSSFLPLIHFLSQHSKIKINQQKKKTTKRIRRANLNLWRQQKKKDKTKKRLYQKGRREKKKKLIYLKIKSDCGDLYRSGSSFSGQLTLIPTSPRQRRGPHVSSNLLC